MSRERGRGRAASGERLEREILEAASVRFAERLSLARELARRSGRPRVWRAASISDRANPVTPLRALWKTGYLLASADTSGLTLELPPL